MTASGQPGAVFVCAVGLRPESRIPWSARFREEYAALLAYIFELNGLPAGDVELPHTSEALALILIEGSGE